MRGVFISYRRDDTSGHAGRLYDRLAARLGKDRVFRDVDTIEAGENFAEVLRRRVENAGVVLVLIGRRWLDSKDASGARRLDNPQDFVRLESEMALARQVPVIPVLVDGAKMPVSTDLPPSLRDLAFRNAVSLDEDTFDFEAEKLAARIAEIIGPGPVRSGGRAKFALATAAAVLAAGLAWWKLAGPAGGAPSAESRLAVETAQGMVKAGDYKGAWDALSARLAAGPDPRVESAREDLAMEWLRGTGARNTNRDPVSAAALDLVAPVLTRGMERSSGVRKADLTAHYGWSLYLRGRLGSGTDPEPVYRQALQLDPANPFANAMLGHWLLMRRREPALGDARELFGKALAAGRERAAVRHLQLTAIENIWEDATDAEYLRAAIDMVKNQEPLEERMVSKAQSVYYFSVADARRRETITAAAAPEDQILLLEHLRKRVPEQKLVPLDMWLGRMEERAGHRERALEAYRRVPTPPDLIDSWRQEVTGAIRRLSK